MRDEMSKVGMRVRGVIRLGALAALAALVLPVGTQAQRPGRRGPQEPPAAPWAPGLVGIRFGYDDSANGEVAGIQIHLPLLRDGKVELMPNADITFVTQLKEYQFNLEAVYVSGGRRGGVYVGGGLAFRNSIFGGDRDTPRQTEQGYSIVVGARSSGRGLLSSQLELRWIVLPDASFDPRQITFGINFPLWGHSNRRGGDRF